MRVALFIPCYIDQFYPQVGIATLQLLEKFGCEVVFPEKQTCCGQPMANSGFARESEKTSLHFIETFKGFDYIVGPSGSCVLHVKEHFSLSQPPDAYHQVKENIFELCQFLHGVLNIKTFDVSFPHKVGLHSSCHGQRGMRLAQSSEINGPDFSIMRDLLNGVKDIELIELTRKDECCGFGGTFAVAEEAVSVAMGNDRVEDHENNGAEVITGGDVSCLMHMEGLISRQNKNLKVLHIAEILNGISI